MSKKLSETLICLSDTMVSKTTAMSKRIEKLETKSAPLQLVETKSLGERIINSKTMTNFLENGNGSGRFTIKQHEIKTAIIGTNTQNDPLGNSSRQPIAEGARRKLFIRDLLVAGSTTDEAVQYPTQNVLTLNAGVQIGGSPEQVQNVTLGESNITFNLSFEPCVTIGHFINTSKQIFDDANVLQRFLEQTMLYGARLAEENQLLNGTGVNGQVNGLLTNATAYTVASPNLTTAADKIRDMILQVETADFFPDIIIVNPLDWFAIETATGTASDPRNMKAPTLWGLPIIVTNSITSGTALVMDSMRSAVLFDRTDPIFEYSYKHDNNMSKNLVTLKVDQRVSLVNVNSLGMVTGAI